MIACVWPLCFDNGAWVRSRELKIAVITGEDVQGLSGLGVVLLGVVCEGRAGAGEGQVWVGTELRGMVS